MVRGGVLVDDSGNLRPRVAGCPVAVDSLNATAGPLLQSWVDAAKVSSSFVPLLGDGSPAEPLSANIGPHTAGGMTVHSFTMGPVLKATMAVPAFPVGTPYTGAAGWWKVWTRDTLQDYRAFAPVHRGQCNMLMADGRVVSFEDDNRDGYLNNGFAPTATNGFTSAGIELAGEEMFSGWSLREKF
jgi:prepilin-type processing-associated H-X9-DG protein